jgi:hypothetical protein
MDEAIGQELEAMVGMKTQFRWFKSGTPGSEVMNAVAAIQKKDNRQLLQKKEEGAFLLICRERDAGNGRGIVLLIDP